MADQINRFEEELRSDFLKSQRMEVEEAEERMRELLKKHQDDITSIHNHDSLNQHSPPDTALRDHH